MGDRVKRLLALAWLRDFIRWYFTRTEYAEDNPSPRAVPPPPGDARKTTRKRRRGRSAEVPPGERFVWGMATLIIALVGVIALEALHILVTGAVNDEMITVISGLVGSLVTAFVMGKKT